MTWFELNKLNSYYYEVDKNNLDLDSAILLFILFSIALILSLKLFIIAYRVPIVTNNSTTATWFEWSDWSAILLALRLYLESIRLLNSISLLKESNINRILVVDINNRLELLRY